MYHFKPLKPRGLYALRTFTAAAYQHCVGVIEHTKYQFFLHDVPFKPLYYQNSGQHTSPCIKTSALLLDLYGSNLLANVASIQ